MVTLEDYGIQNLSNLDELQKALFAGQITGRDTEGLTTASGAPIKTESLEGTLKVLQYNQQDFVLWNKLPKLPAYNTVEEYLQVDSYGGDAGGFINEGELPEEQDSVYIRRSQLVKFIGQVRSVTHQMQLVNTVEGVADVVQQQVEHATLSVLRTADRGCIWGNEAIVPTEYNGFYAQHEAAFSSMNIYFDESGVVIDLRNSVLKESHVEDGALKIIENHGMPSLLMAPPRILSNFTKPYTAFKMIQPNTPAQLNGVAGQKFDKFMSQFGEIELGWDKFMAPGKSKKLSDPFESAKAPAKPVADATTPKAAVTDASNKFTSFLGDYYYAVAAINRFGQSALTDLSTAGSPGALLTVGSGKSVEMIWTAGASAYAATGYVVYRSKANPTTTMANTPLYPIAYISVTAHAQGYDGAGAGKVWDKNRILPDTDQCFLLEPTTQVWSFKQLAPLFKVDLAQVSLSKRFAVGMYGTPILYAPKKFVRFINVGSSLT